ncbi:MAG: ABC transporter substrate-binding protein [Alphaproteobacteria bacterium]
MVKYFYFLLVILSLVACKKEEVVESAKPTVKIGVVLPLSGNLSDVGESAKLLTEKIIKETDNDLINFEIIVEDNVQDVKKTIGIANKFIFLDKVNAIVSAFSGPSSVVTPIANANDVFHLCVANDCNVSSSDTTFTNWQNIAVASNKMMKMLKDKNVKKIVLLTMNDTGNILISKQLNKDLLKNNIFFEEFKFNPQEKDFSFIVQKAASIKDVDYWFLNTLSPALELIKRQMIINKITTPITGIQTFSDAQDKSLFVGYDYVDAAPVDGKLKKYLNRENITVAAYVYDSINMIIKGYNDFYKKHLKIPTAKELSQQLLKMKEYNGAVGLIKIPDDRIMVSETIITQVEKE